jgi:hypothetical protein
LRFLRPGGFGHVPEGDRRDQPATPATDGRYGWGGAGCGQACEKKVTLLGLALKPDSVDLRDSPVLDVAVPLKGHGAHVTATDPEAIPNPISLQPQLGFAIDNQDALYGSDCVVLFTEWLEYRDLDPVALKEHVRTLLIIDGRNVLDPRGGGWPAGPTRGWAALGRVS